ncbi:MAG: asparagine synthase-related protein [Anaerolineales bacterium]
MPGIVGFVGDISPSRSAALVDEMAAALEPDGWFERATFSGPSVGLARIGLESLGLGTQPVWNQDKTRCLIMEGEFYEPWDELRRLTQARPIKSPPELLLALYEQSGPKKMADLNGAFAAAIWDAEAQNLTLITDRLGLQPLYYARTAWGLMFGSGVRSLLADGSISREIDRIAIAEFLTFDHVLRQRTFLTSVALMPQASVLRTDGDRLDLEQYWSPLLPELYGAYDEREYAERLNASIANAVKHMKSDSLPYGLLLSGGLDSRALLASMTADDAYQDLMTFTWGIPGCDDARFAAETARMTGVAHEFFPLPPTWLQESAEACVRTTDGMGNLVNLHAYATLDQESRSVDILYKGFMGDALFGFGLRPRYWARYPRELVPDVHMDAYRDYDVLTIDLDDHHQVFEDAFLEHVGDGILEDYRGVIRDSNAPELAAQRIYIDLTQRVPRMTLNGVLMARQRTIVRLPFADNDLVDFGLQIPPGMLLNRRLFADAFVAADPEMAQIPFTPSGEPLVACARKLVIDGQKLVRWHLSNRGLGRLAGEGIRPYKDYDGWFRGPLRPWIEELVLSRSFEARGYLRSEVVRRLFDEHMAGANHAVRLSAILTLELWHRMYVD